MHKSLYSRPNDVFLALLRDVRLERRLRQSDLAVRLGRSQAIVSRVESGARRLEGSGRAAAGLARLIAGGASIRRPRPQPSGARPALRKQNAEP